MKAGGAGGVKPVAAAVEIASVLIGRKRALIGMDCQDGSSDPSA